MSLARLERYYVKQYIKQYCKYIETIDRLSYCYT